MPLIFSCGKKNVEESYTNEGVCVSGDCKNEIGTLTYKEKTIIGRIFGRVQTKEGLWENGEPIHQNN